MSAINVTRIGSGAFRIEHDGGSDIVYVAGHGGARWIFWNGHVFHDSASASGRNAAQRTRHTPEPRGTPTARETPETRETLEILTAPMPARVVQVLVQPGARVKKGETVVLLEAMKMELPVRATADAEVLAVHCHAGELVQADAPLVDLR